MNAEESSYDILHVEDKRNIMVLARSVLEREDGPNYSFHSASRPDEAYQKMRENDIDLVITDLKIPKGKEGLTVADRVQEEYGVPVVMYTMESGMESEFIERAPDQPRGFYSKEEDSAIGLREEVERFLE